MAERDSSDGSAGGVHTCDECMKHPTGRILMIRFGGFVVFPVPQVQQIICLGHKLFENNKGRPV